MAGIEKVGRVLVPVSDQDRAIAFYTGSLDFTLLVDVPFGDGDRWVEVLPPSGGTTVALVTPQSGFDPGRPTGIGYETSDARATHALLKAAGVDVDAELTGGDGTVPPMFFFRDEDHNTYFVAQAR